MFSRLLFLFPILAATALSPAGAQTKAPAAPTAVRAADQTIKIWAEGDWGGKLPGDWKISGPEAAVRQSHMGGTTALSNVSVPLLEYFKPAAAQAQPGAKAVIICPGGGYGILAWDLEGTEIANWLGGLGCHAFVLKYRLPRPGDVRYAAALEDAQRSVSLVRERAATLGIAPDKIGIMGFSAGGHLAAITSTTGNARTYPAKDKIDATPCRPNFTGLIYSAYLLKGDAAAGEMAPEFHFTPETPPASIAHALDDGIPVANALGWLTALKGHKVSAELHVYPDGGHGYGLRSDKTVKAWPDQMAAWLARF